jgi:uncharacterized cupredoxin-like copper-binding protein
MSRRRAVAIVGLVVPLVLSLPACGGDDEATVEVTLQEFAVIPSESSVSAGSVTFEATNEGPEDDHELVVIRTDLAPDALPTSENGSVDEAGEGIEVLDEIEEFPPGETESLTLDLEAGSYVLICNIFDESEQEAHYAEGMRVAFSVA